ncbi:hypothetical protein TNCV_3509471 [Trichonephila clavipes]|nr:hypothetical protein TNCV_3509471 [Trichonephila clavipes]
MLDRCLIIRELDEEVEISSHTGSSRAILCDHAQSGCEFYSPSLCWRNRKTPSCRCTESTRHYEPCFSQLLAVPENENAIERIPFSELRDQAECDGGI